MSSIEIRLPTVGEYLSLREAVDWKVPSREEGQAALASSVTAVVAVADDGVVGSGRIVGDGTFYNFVVDLMVRPEEQGSGIGRRLLAILEQEVAARSATGVLQLVADDQVTGFYERCGYERSTSNLLTKRLP